MPVSQGASSYDSDALPITRSRLSPLPLTSVVQYGLLFQAWFQWYCVPSSLRMSRSRWVSTWRPNQMNCHITLSSPYPCAGRFLASLSMYCTDASAVRREFSLALPLSPAVVRVHPEAGKHPLLVQVGHGQAQVGPLAGVR